MRPAVLILAAILVPAAASAGAELVLEDGQVIQGVELERKDDVYILRLATGSALTLPAGLVKEWRLTAEGEPEEKEAPTGIRETGPEELSGNPNPPPLPNRADQIEAFDKPPARFRNNIIDPNWTPESDWETDSDLNNFNPSRWYRPPIDPTWEPESAFDRDVDVLRGNRSTWQKSIVDPSWTPTDGFSRRRVSWKTYSSGSLTFPGNRREDIELVPDADYVPRIRFRPGS